MLSVLMDSYTILLKKVEKRDNIINYERKTKDMQNAQEQGKGSTYQAPSNETSTRRQIGKIENGSNKTFKKWNESLGMVTLFLGIVSTIAIAVIAVIRPLAIQGKDIEALKGDVKELDANYDDMNYKIDNLTDLVKEDHEIFLELAAIDTEGSTYNILFKDIYRIRTEEVKSEEYLASPSWEDGDVIASDAKGDIIYNPEDLYNKPIITSYLDGSNEVYFYGRFNENNHWNGKCILNTYNEDKLVSIFEGIYDDGELFSYKTASVSISDENDNGEIWLINNRIHQGEYDSGETWKYTKTNDFVKGFTLEDVKEKQILTCDKVLNSKNEKLLSYYKGNIANGLYNDETGNAYLVKYKMDGDVRYLYKGRMKEGKAHDDSGDAWEFSWGHADDGYHYHKGGFEDGKPINIKKDWNDPVEQEFINSVINPDKFNCPLTGLIELGNIN